MITKPYANESDSLAVGDLTVENRMDRISIYGSLDLTRDKGRLAHARELKRLLDRVVRELDADKELPDKIAPPEPPQMVKNPFSSSRPIGNVPPADFAMLSAPAMQQGGSLRSLGASRPTPLHYRACKAQMRNGLYSDLDERKGSGQWPSTNVVLWWSVSSPERSV